MSPDVLKSRLAENAALPRYWPAPGRPGWETDDPSNHTEGLQELIASLPPLKMACEVGSFAGVSTETLALMCGHVISVDPWVGDGERAWPAYQARMERHRNASAIKLYSSQALPLFGRVFDLVYIDANHSLKFIRADIKGWREKVVSGGYLAGHDYTRWTPDVVFAVEESFAGKYTIFRDGSWVVKL